MCAQKLRMIQCVSATYIVFLCSGVHDILSCAVQLCHLIRIYYCCHDILSLCEVHDIHMQLHML